MDATQTKVTQADVDSAIAKVDYVVLPDGRTTIALLTLDNGFTVRGESACVVLEEFDQAKGEHYALEDAKKWVWRFLGFRLADLRRAETSFKNWQQQNLASHDFQRYSNDQGIGMCSRCGTSELAGKQRSCSGVLEQAK